MVDTELESSWAPFDQVEAGLCLECGNRSGGIAGHNVTTVQEADGHVLSVAGVTDNHLVVWLEALVGQVGYLERLVGGSGVSDNWGIGDQWVMNTCGELEKAPKNWNCEKTYVDMAPSWSGTR